MYKITIQDAGGQGLPVSVFISSEESAALLAARVKSVLSGENGIWQDGYGAGQKAEATIREQNL